MKTYLVYLKKNDPDALEKAIFVKEGFSIFAAVFKVFWALYYRMWLSAFALFSVSICFVLMEKYATMGGAILLGLRIGFVIFIGFSARDWYCSHLEKQGFELSSVVSGRDMLEVKQRFFDSKIS